jgi:hypothetical protein
MTTIGLVHGGLAQSQAFDAALNCVAEAHFYPKYEFLIRKKQDFACNQTKRAIINYRSQHYLWR